MNSIEKVVIFILIFVLGAAMGSFVTCQAWRLRYKELGKKKLGMRSVCLSCGHKLKWYENVPVLSWILLGGKCSKCGKKIGIAEILAEVLMGLAFVGVVWVKGGLEVMDWWLVLILILITILGFLAVYDGLFGELPVVGLWIGGAVAFVIMIARILQDSFDLIAVINNIGAIAILGGVYLILYLASKGKWVGDGDWILGVILGMLLGESWLALITLFLANFLGCVVMWPKVKDKNKKKQKIYFGPFLVIGCMLALIFGNYLMLMVK